MEVDNSVTKLQAVLVMGDQQYSFAKIGKLL